MAKNIRVVGSCCFAAIGSLLFGLDMGYIGPILEDAEFKRDVVHLVDWDEPDAEVPGTTSGVIVSAFALGCMASAFPLVSSFFVEVLGRRAPLATGGVVFLLGCAIQAAAGGVPVMVTGRFVSGCSIGILSTVVPLYQSELAPPQFRGTLTSLSQVMICFGVSVASFADQVLLPLRGGWRFAVLLPVLPGLVLLLGMPFLPESPRWLVSRGRAREALAVLGSVRIEGAAEAELREIVADRDAAQASGRGGWRELRSGRVSRLLAVGIGLQLMQQLTGINAFVAYGPRIFRSLGLSAAHLQTALSLALFFGTLPATCLIERFGRRGLLASGAVGMLVASVLMAVLGTIFTTDDVGGRLVISSNMAGVVIVVCIFLFVFSFAYSWGPTTWVYCAEIFPMKVRGECVGLTTMAEWSGVFLVNQFTPMLLSAIGFQSFFVFGAFGAVAVALALWLPETKGVPLEHMDQVFAAKFGAARTEVKGCNASARELGRQPHKPQLPGDGEDSSESASPGGVESQGADV